MFNHFGSPRRLFLVMLQSGSAYGFGWGYCAFSIPIEAIYEYLGAADSSTKQLMLAFELGRKRISKAVEQAKIPETGDRIILDRLDA